MNFSLIDTVDSLHDAVTELRQQARIACDLEADGLHRYRAKVCVLQLSTPSHVYVIDALSAWDPTALQPVLGAEGPTKIIHDLSFDARLLREAGIALGRVQDTSIAARMLGEKALGLGSLLSSRLGVQVDKDRQKHDWSKRPLHADDVEYLVGDVEHLPTLADRLAHEVEQRAIAEEVALETEYLLSRALVEPSGAVAPGWTRVKGVHEQPPVVQSVLRELWIARDEIAQRRDVPPFKVVGEDVLVAASARQPKSPDALIAMGFRGSYARAATDRWLSAIRRGQQRGDIPDEERQAPTEAPPTRQQRNLWKARESALKAWRAAAAKERGVEPAVVLPGHCLTDLVHAPEDSMQQLEQIAGFGAVRIARYGEQVLRLLSSATSPSAPNT